MTALPLPSTAPERIPRGTGAEARPGGGQIAVLRPRGVIDGAAVVELRSTAATAGTEAVAIDVTDAVLGDRHALVELAAVRWPDGVAVCVVCHRLSGRRLLIKAGLRLPVFASVQDAVQARVLEAAGFGSGWS